MKIDELKVVLKKLKKKNAYFYCEFDNLLTDVYYDCCESIICPYIVNKDLKMDILDDECCLYRLEHLKLV